MSPCCLRNNSVRHCGWVNIIGIAHCDGHGDKGLKVKMIRKVHVNNNDCWWVNMIKVTTWWCHQMETFSTLLALCAGNSLVTVEFPLQRPVKQSFDVLFYLFLNKQLSKNRESDGLRCHRAHYDVRIMSVLSQLLYCCYAPLAILYRNSWQNYCMPDSAIACPLSWVAHWLLPSCAALFYATLCQVYNVILVRKCEGPCLLP